MPGPPDEVAVVRSIYSLFVNEGKTESVIAKVLNEHEIPNHLGRLWVPSTVRYLLKSEKYIGNYVWNRKSFKLRKTVVHNAPNSWLRSEGAFEPIIDRELFDAAQAIFRSRPRRTFRGRPRGLSNEQMLDRLSRLLLANGRLTRAIINNANDTPSYWSYKVRFGSVATAYGLIGFTKKPKEAYASDRAAPYSRRLDDDDMLDALRRLYQERGYLSHKVIDDCDYAPSTHALSSHFGSITRAYDLIGYTRPYKTRPSLSNDQMLDRLRIVAARRGDLSRKIINETDEIPSAASYYDRFGGLTEAYKLIGFRPRHFKAFAKRGISNEQMLQHLANLLRERGQINR